MNRELLEQLLSERAENQGEKLTDVQIVTRLQDIAAHKSEEHAFKYGDILIHKWPKSANVKSAGNPVIFLGYLDESFCATDKAANIEDLFSSGSPRVFDCVTGTITDGTFVEYLQDSSEYRPHPDFQSN